MRIFCDESKAGLNPVPHQFGISEHWNSLGEALADIEKRLREQGDRWTVLRMEGTPYEGINIELDVHDPPVETNITLVDADAYEAKLGYSAEEHLKFILKHGPCVEALMLSSPGATAAAMKSGFRTIRPAVRMPWLTDWALISKRIRSHAVVRAMIVGDDGNAVRLRVWDVLLGVSGDARPMLVCEGLDKPIAGSINTLIDSDKPRRVPFEFVHVPWEVLKQAVRNGRSVLIGESIH